MLKCASPSQLNQVKAAIAEQAAKQTELFENLAVRIIEKQLHTQVLALYLLSLALPILVPVERDKVVQYFAELESHAYLKTKEGAQVANCMASVVVLHHHQPERCQATQDPDEEPQSLRRRVPLRG